MVLIGIVVRPFQWPEAVWAAAGGLALPLLGLLPWTAAWAGVREGWNVYLFLIGMMALAEIARTAGVFDSLAAWALRRARGSPTRLFLLLYAMATIVTALLSNDATAVVMPPAVYAATRAAGVAPLPYLLICAFVAGAASFVLPISNPANLVVYGRELPDLAGWLSVFTLPSIVSIGTTLALLWLTQRRALGRAAMLPATAAATARASPTAIAMLSLTAVVIVGASALHVPLGLPTLLSSAVTAAVVLGARRQSPRALLARISWSVIPLVAGLFVIVEALRATGVVDGLAAALARIEGQAPLGTAWLAGAVTALAANLANNLPTGLLASLALQQADASALTRSAVMIAIDLGPNLSITGSLGTILWAIALRREGLRIGFRAFLKLGLIMMPLPLAGALAALIATFP
ncbi:MAG: SLC13 family permease [Burkholderiaceae bacterium]